MADTPITPPTGSLGFSGEEVYFINSGDSKMFFTGYAPAVIYLSPVIPVATGSLSLNGKTPRRRQGLELTGFAPTLRYSWNVSPSTGAINLTGKSVFPVKAAPPNKTIQPETGSIGFTGTSSAVFVQKIVPATGSLSLTGQSLTATQTTPKYPFFGRLRFTGQPVTIEVANSGTSITNPWATDDVESNYQIDDRTGFKIKVKDPMVEEYTGHMVRPESLDRRSEQEFIRSKPENQKGPTRPEPVGNERHIDTEFPDGVDPDTDL